MRFLIFSVVFSIFAWSASAVTMTFDGISGIPSNSYSENGINAQSRAWIGPFRSPGAVHMDSGGTSYASRISFSMASAFDAVSFDLLPIGMNFVSCVSRRNCTSATYSNVQVQGYRGSSVVASLQFYMGTQSSTVRLGSLFSNLTSLTLSVLSGGPLGPGTAGTFCTINPCSHLNIDNVTVAPVPLPAALPLFGIAIAGLGLLRRRRAKASR